MARSNNAEMKAYSYMKEQILSGIWPPTKHIVEQEVAEELGVSRSPIRRAITRLAGENLVQCEPNKGALICERVLGVQEIIDRICILEYMLCYHIRKMEREHLKVDTKEIRKEVAEIEETLEQEQSLSLLCHQMNNMLRSFCSEQKNQYFSTIMVNILQDICHLTDRHAQKKVRSVYKKIVEAIQSSAEILGENQEITLDKVMEATKVLRYHFNDIQILLLK
ncbi:GntR family transcriptional regulator [Catellicoccus marimammalium]|uniref:Transcriptional regulator, GntR family n=1 Tax=Catellicoccus marimammalium M35/04/3 TaxID=1234409 RepID=K8ZLR3_9ENTE|nr:GntR family transcriptional regulator [Catellicoccus marimammalium]EKU27488.1 Transcriptional regulator, GntR family [Catellicoccus marimammalium M35/04/3]